MIVAMVVGILLARTIDRPEGEAVQVLGPLPPGYVYATMEADDREATSKLFRDGYGAEDVAVALVGTPQDRAPVGVTVVVLVLRAPPQPLDLARRLERDVTLVDPMPKALAGQPVLSHEGDATYSSVTLWVQGRLAILTYGATSAEVDGVMEGLLAGGGWRATAAAQHGR